jgi:hypothetical protein
MNSFHLLVFRLLVFRLLPLRRRQRNAQKAQY